MVEPDSESITEALAEDGDWIEDQLLTLLNWEEVGMPADRTIGDDWFDDVNPEGHFWLADLGLVEGLEHGPLSGGGYGASIDESLHLTAAGRAIAERARRARLSRARPRTIFMSYVHEDAEAAAELRSRLDLEGFDVWIDAEQLLPGDDWQARITEAIRSATAFVPLFSRASVARERSYMRDEVLQAIDELRMRPVESGWFVPVVIDDSELPEYRIAASRSLRDIHFVRLSDDRESELSKLVEALARLQPPGAL